MGKKKNDERDIIYEVLSAFSAFSLKLPLYYDLLKFVDDRKYLDAILYLSDQRRKKNISKSSYDALVFVLRTADALWRDHYKDFLVNPLKVRSLQSLQLT